MGKTVKMLIGILLLLAAAILPFSKTYVKAGSASSSDFQMKGSKLVKYTGTAKAVSIPTSVKEIGEEAFAGHTELVKVVIPPYVEKIGYNSFAGCESLESISLPDTVAEIGNGAFSECTSLKSVKIGKGLSKIGTGVFAGCNKLSSVSLSTKNEYFLYEKGILYTKDQKELILMLPGYNRSTYSMPSKVEYINSYAFWGCQYLKKVEIGSNVKKIPDYAFSNCVSLERVTFPFSLRSIDLKAFADCENLGVIELPPTVSYIHPTAFDNCPKLNIVAEKGTAAAEFELSREKGTKQGRFDDILPADQQEEEVQEETKETETEASDTKLLGQSRIVGRQAVVLMDGSSGVLTGNPIAEKLSKMPVVETSKSDSIVKYTIVDDVKIAEQSYYQKKDLTEFEIPDTIQTIGDFAFARSGLQKIEIPQGVTEIGYAAFYHCEDLSEIIIPDSVTEIGASAFAKTPWMEARLKDRANPFLIVGDGILLAYSGMNSSVEIPKGVKKIAAGAFQGNTRITKVELPESLEVIGEDAFAGCKSLKTLTGGTSVGRIEDRAFQGCPISTIKIPASVKSIGMQAFDISGSGKKDAAKTAVFLGKELPQISYGTSAGRMDAQESRSAVFEDVTVVVVDGSITAADIASSVLDYEKAGYRGFICSVESEPRDQEPGVLQLKFCSMDKKKVTSGTIPEEVIIYGNPYVISIPDNQINYLSGGQTSSAAGSIHTEVNSPSLSAEPGVSVEGADLKENYVFSIQESAEAGSKITSAYKRAMSGKKIYSLQVYEISVTEERTGISIKEMGNKNITVQLPIPKGIREKNVKVLYMDQNNQLESVAAEVLTVDGEPCIQFRLEKTGIYGIYN